MTAFAAIADDLTGACDVAAELAVAGWRVRVAVDPAIAPDYPGDALVVVNTQSRSLDAADAYGRVRDSVHAHPAQVVLKKIDTALRGHLGAELDGALDALAAPGFVVAAIPAAGRVTRNGCQWFGGRLLATTEFARDPEGPGAVSSIPAVLARESRRRARVIDVEAVRNGQLAHEVGRRGQEGVDVFVVDAESDADVAAAVAAILALQRPVCLAGSIALVAALAPHLEHAARPRAGTARDGVPLPALIVSGSLHSRAREQVDAALATERAMAVSLPPAGEDGDAVAATAAAVRTRLAAGMSVVLASAPAPMIPTSEGLRATEHMLAAVVAAVAASGPIPTLVLVGGETSHAILMRIGASLIEVHGRIAPLIARGVIAGGTATGSTVVTKGGSGGEPDVIARLIVAGAPRVVEAEA